MGLLERLFPRAKKTRPVTEGSQGALFETLTAYRPAFTTWDGQMYESELIRAVVDAKARHIAKLSVTFDSKIKAHLKAATRSGANPWQTWPQMLYRTSTILDMCNNCPIVPVLDEFDRTVGFFPVLPTSCELVESNGKVYMRYTFKGGQRAAIEFDRVALLTRHQFRDDIFGESNNALDATLALLDMQRQGIEEGVRNSATFRFMARLDNFAKPEDIAKERARFNKDNLQGESNGILLFPNTYKDIQQVETSAYNVDPAQTKLIRENVFNYFGCNDKVLQSSAMGDELDAFFAGSIEPLAIQLSDGLTRMVYTPEEIRAGSKVLVTANRLQYMSMSDKISFAQGMTDRGMLKIDEVRELFGYSALPDGQGQHVPMRGEYYFSDIGKEQTKQAGAQASRKPERIISISAPSRARRGAGTLPACP